jgi:hypothetical protein
MSGAKDVELLGPLAANAVQWRHRLDGACSFVAESNQDWLAAIAYPLAFSDVGTDTA